MATEKPQNEDGKKLKGLEDLIGDPIIEELKKQQQAGVPAGDVELTMNAKQTKSAEGNIELTSESQKPSQQSASVQVNSSQASSTAPSSVQVQGQLQTESSTQQQEQQLSDAAQAAKITGAFELSQQSQLNAIAANAESNALATDQAAEQSKAQETQQVQSAQQQQRQQQMELEKQRREEYLKRQEQQQEAARKKKLLQQNLKDQAKNSLLKKGVEEATGLGVRKVLRAGFAGIPGVNVSYFALDGLYSLLKWSRKK